MAMKIADSNDCIAVFNTPEGRIVLNYLLKSYYWRSSYVPHDCHETARNEGKREVVLDLIDKMRSLNPIDTATMLSNIELEGVR